MPDIVIDSLTEAERTEHRERIGRILDGFQAVYRTSLQVWTDLKWIRDNRTYREEYDNFVDFCREELGKDNSQIYRYIRDAEFKETLLLEADSDAERSSILNLKEGNTRFIRTLPEEAQAPFWKLAYGIGYSNLPKKQDGSIELTTGYLESVGSSIDEVMTSGGIHIDGEFVSLSGVDRIAEVAGVDEATAKRVLISAGVSEDYFEVLKRQEQHIKERSARADITAVRGTIEVRQDTNGSDYPVLVDDKMNELDLSDLILSFNGRHVNISIKTPARQVV